VPPLAAGLAFAALAALARWAGRGRVATPTAPAGAAQAVVYVQFELRAPGARSVAVGGDFDGWSGSNALEDPDGDGVWTGRVAVQPGLHTYMFLVDGDDWVTDPDANRYTDDGFGNRNAVLAVAAPAA
jgi:1,4-alpha-glucan branching enzyme